MACVFLKRSTSIKAQRKMKAHQAQDEDVDVYHFTHVTNVAPAFFRSDGRATQRLCNFVFKEYLRQDTSFVSSFFYIFFISTFSKISLTKKSIFIFCTKSKIVCILHRF